MAKKCVSCGEWFNEQDMQAIFTGRTKYMCFKCYTEVSHKIDERNLIHAMAKRKKHDK